MYSTRIEYEPFDLRKSQTPYYLLIAGSRTYCDTIEFSNVMDSFIAERLRAYRSITIVSGGCHSGADAMAECYAVSRGLNIVVLPADWKQYGKRAGYIRNEEMHIFIEQKSTDRGCLLFWDMCSKGTAHSIHLSQKHNNPLWIYNTLEHKFLGNPEMSLIMSMC